MSRIEAGALVEVWARCVPPPQTLVGEVVGVRAPTPPFGSQFKVRLTEKSQALLVKHSPVGDKRAIPAELWWPGDRLRLVCG